MRVVRDLGPWICPAEATVGEALERISANREGVVFTVEEDGRLHGVLTDGDFRRWVMGRGVGDLTAPVCEVANTDPVSAPDSVGLEGLGRLFDDRVAHIPLLDARGRLVGVATDRGSGVVFEGLRVADDAPALVVAEIGINHNGSLDAARSLVDEAARAGAHCAKFQMRDLASLYRNAGTAFDPREDLGAQYTLDLLDRFALDDDELFAAFDHCRDVGVVPVCTPWDLRSVEALEGYGLAAYKIASADLTNHDLIAAVAATGRPVLMSTGMSEESEIIEAVRVLQHRGAAFVLLHCNSTYPAPFRDLNLRYLARLRELGGGPVGYSGHERGWHVAVAAVALGARVVEKHLTLDRSQEGVDHKVSLLPTEFASMVTQIAEISEAMGSAEPRHPGQGELMNRVTLAKSLVATRDLTVGQVVTTDDVAVRSPGRGLQPNRRAELLGRRLTREVRSGGFFYASDLDAAGVGPRPYRFSRPWGLPVRFHDVDRLTGRSDPDFVEFHLGYQDLELDPATFLSGTLPRGFAVHSPDLFRGDHLLNLAAEDPAYRARSLTELARVVAFTRHLGAWFPATERPVLIVSLGGFTSDGPLPVGERPRLYERIREGLAELDCSGVELVAQTLPPFPWYLGGQLFCNLFVDPVDTAGFVTEGGPRLCLDVSHSKLAANHLRLPFSEFVEQVGAHAAHLHLVDARGVDGEGVQIGEGEIDWAVLAGQLDRLAPGVGFIPEIWQGHRNDGEGFWVALDRLERWF